MKLFVRDNFAEVVGLVAATMAVIALTGAAAATQWIAIGVIAIRVAWMCLRNSSEL